VTVSLPGIPTSVQNLIQQDVLERMFHDSLFPAQLFRAEAQAELWEANLGESMLFTRPGLIPVSTKPLVQSSDPTPASYAFEQWRAEAAQYGTPLDTHMPTSSVSLSSMFMRNTQQLGLNAGQTLNRIVRDKLFRAYLGGNTNLAVAALAAATQVEVASLNGFTEIVANARPVDVSAGNPLAVTIDGVANTVIGTVPVNAADPLGRGLLLLGTPLAAPAALRAVVLAGSRSRITRVGGGTSVDAITSGNILALQDIINATARLRRANVPTMPDGFYHVHLGPEAEAQIFQDPQFQRLYDGVPEGAAYKELAIAQLVGCRFYRNNEVPSDDNSGSLVATGSSAQGSSDIGGDVVNAAGRAIRRTIVIGGAAVYEKYLDESRYITEAGVTGKIGSFSITNGGVQVMTDRIRYIIRAPLDRAQQVVGQMWSWSGDFAIPTDLLTGDSARFKRAVVIEHA